MLLADLLKPSSASHSCVKDISQCHLIVGIHSEIKRIHFKARDNDVFILLVYCHNHAKLVDFDTAYTLLLTQGQHGDTGDEVLKATHQFSLSFSQHTKSWAIKII